MRACFRQAHVLRRFSGSASTAEVQGKVDRLNATLREAIEATKYISDSAQQAYLETDPSARGQPESYTARYKGFACSQIETAIADYDKLSHELGEARMQEIRNDSLDLGLAIADALLARDQLKASIRDDKDKLERKTREGLRKDDLIFCDGPS